MYKKIILSIAMMATTTTVLAAKVEDLSIKPAMAAQTRGSLPAPNLQQENLKILGKFKDKSGNLHIRSKQMFKGIPIWNFQVIEHQSQRLASGSSYTGYYVSQIESDLAKVAAPVKTEAEVLAFIRAHHLGTHPVASVLEDGQAKPYIYLDQDKVAHQVYEVSFAADAPEGNHPSLPTFIVDAQSLVIYKQWDAMMHQRVGEGPGGNVNTGRYVYGKDFEPFDIKVKRKSVCVLKNDYVKTVDLKNKKKGVPGKQGSIPVRYGCNAKKSHYFHDESMVNGAYGVTNDAHAFGQAIVGMYHDWYDINPLPIQLVMQVHYGVDFANAMWDSRALVMSFGDGDNDNMYPLVSLDVAAHEVAHGITQFSSDLFYMGQSGGLNESFSDMAAQAALYYFYGESDWQIGSRVMKSGQALRYMDDPKQDGRSIAHTSEYYDGMDVHFSSGVYNKAFYNLATTPGWDTMLAYTVFYYANLTEWQPVETFSSAGCGTIRAAKALYAYSPEFNPDSVIAALKSVGIYYNPDTQRCRI